MTAAPERIELIHEVDRANATWPASDWERWQIDRNGLTATVIATGRHAGHVYQVSAIGPATWRYRVECVGHRQTRAQAAHGITNNCALALFWMRLLSCTRGR